MSDWIHDAIYGPSIHEAIYGSGGYSGPRYAYGPCGVVYDLWGDDDDEEDDPCEDDIRAGEIQFSQNHPGRVSEYHGTSHDGTSQGIFDSGHPHSHTVRKDGYVVYHRDQYGNEVIDTDE